MWTGSPGRLARLCLATALLAGNAAHGSPLEDTTNGGAVFTGPTHPDATSIYINPAALGLASLGTHLYLGGSLQLDSYAITRQRITDPDTPASPGPRVTPWTAAPGGTVGLFNVGTTASLGVALGLPLTQEFIENEQELGYHTLGGYHRQLNWGSFGAAFRVNDRLFFGTGISLTATWLKLSFLRDTALERDDIAGDCGGAPCGIENPAAAERYDVAVSSQGLLGTQNLAINAGIVYQVAQDWWVGISYQSPAGLQAPLTLTGSARITPAPRDRPCFPNCTDAPETVDARAEIIYKLPQTVYVGVRGPVLPGTEVVAGARWQNLSLQQSLDLRLFGSGSGLPQNIPERYPRYVGLSDVVLVEAGIETELGRALRLGTRLRYESGATATNAMSPLMVDGENYTLVAGAEVRLLDNLVVTASYGGTWFLKTTVRDSLFDPRDYLACVDSQYDIDVCTAAAQGRAIPSAAGTYDRFRHAARVWVRYSFL